MSKEFEELVAEGKLWRDDSGHLQFNEASPEKYNNVRNFAADSNAVMIVGYPKTGSHLMMAITDQLGVKRAEDYEKGEKKIRVIPYEFQSTTEIVSLLSDIVKSTDEPVGLLHCHVWPEHFPTDFKGKILFVERDPRAVAVSAFHFLGKIYSWYFEKFALKTVDDFALHYLENKLPFGRNDLYDQKWKEFAANNPNLDIQFFKYEEIMKDKKTHIPKIADFLKIANYDLASVIEKTSIDKTRLRRKEQHEKDGKPFKEEAILYRKGGSSWEEALSPDVIEKFNSIL